MEPEKRKSSLGPILIVFFVILLFVTGGINMTNGAHADGWVILVIMAVVVQVGALIGCVFGGLIGLVGTLFKKGLFGLGLKYGAVVGFMLFILFWLFGCLWNGTAVCIAQ